MMKLGSSVCGVYLLRDSEGSVMYVGQSVNVLGRIGAHAGDIAKTFASITVLECERDQLDDLEGLLIRTLSPPLNGGPGPQSALLKGIQHWGPVPKSKRRFGDGLTYPAKESDDLVRLMRDVRIKANVGQNAEGFVGTKSISELCGGIGLGTITRLEREEGFPASKKVGGKRIWRKIDVLHWLDAKFNEPEHTSQNG